MSVCPIDAWVANGGAATEGRPYEDPSTIELFSRA